MSDPVALLGAVVNKITHQLSWCVWLLSFSLPPVLMWGCRSMTGEADMGRDAVALVQLN